MRVIRTPAYQGHAIPQTAHRPQGPFPSEILAPNPVEPVEPEDVNPWANAQNNYLPPAWVRCRLCNEVMTEDETDAHRCGDGQK